MWAALSIIVMWLVVLFVGLFGGDFVSTSSAGSFTKFPVVVFVLPFVLPATIVVARRGFTSEPEQGQPASEEQKEARVQPTDQPSTFRTKTA